MDLTKRQNVRVINQCPSGDAPASYNVFRISTCITLTYWLLTCQRPASEGPPALPEQEWLVLGECARNEICYQATAPDAPSVAWCVSASPELTLYAAPTAKLRRMYFGSQKNAGAVLTRQDDDALFNAAELAIVPRNANNESLAQPTSCSECSRISWINPPPNTDNYQINATLQSSGESVILHATDEL